jgi:hypothetical protein
VQKVWRGLFFERRNWETSHDREVGWTIDSGGKELGWVRLNPTIRSGPAGLLHDVPILKPAQWTRHDIGVETEAELKALRHSLGRGTPFGATY